MISPLARQIVDYCRSQERRYVEIYDEVGSLGFDATDSAIGEALRDGKLRRRLDEWGYAYSATFPGVDIDAVHRKVHNADSTLAPQPSQLPPHENGWLWGRHPTPGATHAEEATREGQQGQGRR